MNRTLKRPMFRIGGPVNQGSGIMSHVEPKNYMTGGRVGFKFGTIPGFQNQTVTPQDESGLDIILRNYGANNLDMQQSGLNSLRGNTESSETTPVSSGYGKQNLNPFVRTYQSQFNNPDEPGFWKRRSALDSYLKEKGIINEKSSALDVLKARTENEKEFKNKQVSERGDIEFGNPEGDKVWNADKPIPKKEPEYVETPKTDPREAIKKDRDFLKSILEGEDYEDMSKGEVALIVARALAEPGPIANKIKVANELAIPVIRSKRKEDRELTLEAYKTYREKEIEDIKAGRPGDVEKRIRARADAYIKGNPQDPRTQTVEGRKQILDEVWAQQTGEEKPLEKIKQIGYSTASQTIESKTSAIRNAQKRIASGEKLSKDDEKKLADDIEYVNYIKARYPDYFKANYKDTFKTGGRVGFAEGTADPEYSTNERPTVESTPTPEDAGTQQSQLKPVVKLSFQELRNRLPKEITNDIVGLISNSEQALQDFAYIKTQQDVNNFNIKYGVNLVLPSNR
jgi:hypothetical protein